MPEMLKVNNRMYMYDTSLTPPFILHTHTHTHTQTAEIRLKDTQERLATYEQRAVDQTRTIAELTAKVMNLGTKGKHAPKL